MSDQRFRAAVHRGPGHYPEHAPFDTHSDHPELPGPRSLQPNPAHDAVRSALRLLYPPGPRYGDGAQWNPLGELIEPGQTVFIKPNLVDHEHRFGGDIWSVITHPSVVRAVVDYVAIALRGDGRIQVGDNPHVDCSWDVLSQLYRMDLIADRIDTVHGVEVDFVDLRGWHVPDLTNYGWRAGREPLAGDPSGEHVIELTDSYLDDANWWLFRGTLNERLETIKAHRNGHRYAFSNTIMNADTYVSVPKLKSHAKVGATLNIKGLIGTISNKNSLVHWAIGYPKFGGDEYPNPDSWLDYPRLYWQHLTTDLLPSRAQLAIRDRLGTTGLGSMYRSLVTTEAQHQRLLRGAWDGNDTTWRMTADVHDAFVGLPDEPRRPTLSIIDGIVGGDTDGPHFPHRVASGAVIAAQDLLTADLVAARLMDFDPDEIPYLRALRRTHELELDDIDVLGVDAGFFDHTTSHLGYRPPNRWPNLSLAGRTPAGDFLNEARHERVAA